ncbi:class I SAM-dependent methyltransferase [Myxococcus fulvus]|uniref:class I SAM-dependent methyltransferase n=1 Tax=Myxococcus fulvus TaxID=33 RepID=UPI003B99D0B2
MAAGTPSPLEQEALWKGPAGHAWVDTREALEQLFKPFESLFIEAVRTSGAHRVLDVGCGTGSTTLAVARHLGATGQCVGLDVSTPMLAVAREQAEAQRVAARFIEANAETYAFEPASFDLVMSRFGVMFFDDPVRAFTNLRRAATRDARLCCVAWRSPEENPFMTTAEKAAAPFLTNIPPRVPDAPGQFAFADPNRVQRILEQSGWTDLTLRAIDVPCTMPARSLAQYVTRLGPVGRVIQELDEKARARLVDTLLAAFSPFVHGDEVRLTAACWRIEARAPAVAT